MPDHRLFLALNPRAESVDVLRRAVAPLAAQRWPRPRWLVPEQWHATLRFLGATPAAAVPYWQGVLELLAGIASEPTALTIDGLALWPSPARPRVMVVTAQAEAWAQETAARAEALARDAGYRPDTRPFLPHITLARLGPGAVSTESVAALETAAQALRGTTLAFDSLSLFVSRTPPEGPWFERLATVPLRAAPR